MAVVVSFLVLTAVANLFALASLARSIETMSLASKALVAASTTLVATAQAIADNQPAPGGDPSTSDTPETTQDVTTAAANTGLSHDGEFRLADKITLRTSGAGGLEILKAGDPTPIQISDVELALMIDERYFARVDKGL